MEAKKQTRKEALRRRKALSAGHKKEFSSKIVETFIKSQEFRHADMVLVYISTADEVSTHELLQYCWENGKRTAAPKVLAPHEMEFYEIQSFEDLKAGFKGILEPEETTAVQMDNVIIIVPGVAFDEFGNRLGYGGGFYDSYLQKHPQYKKAAFAFSMQITKEIPVESQDVGMDIIYTEKGVYRIW